MKRVFQFALILTLFFSYKIQAQAPNLQSIINKAGAQRALSQKMTKNYMLIGMGIRVEEATKELDQSMAMFNENLHAIVFFNKSKKTEKATDKVNELWTRFRVYVSETPKKENAVQLITASTELMNACHEVVLSLIDNNAGNEQNLQLINRCGLQRRNSQRIAMLYIAKAWGVEYNVEKELNEVVDSFETTLDYLLKNPTNSQEIEKILKFHRGEWVFLKKTFDVTTTAALKPEQVASSSKLIFKDFDALTGMYEKL